MRLFNCIHYKFYFIIRPYSEGGKHTVFVANTIPLVLQQCEYISRLTGLSCAMINSNTGVDFWNDAIWMEQLEKHQVLKSIVLIIFNLCVID